jgi:hypothetical protein
MFSLTVVSAIAPSVTLGKLTPLFGASDRGEVLGGYAILLTDYPELATIGGSVKLVRDEQLLLNPDHLDWKDDNLRAETNAFSCKRGWYPIAVTRVKESGADAFTAVSTLCPHEAEYQVTFDPLRFQFVCCHQFSSFRHDGTWIDPSDPDAADPLAPNFGRVKNGLKKFAVSYDGANTVTLDIPSFGAEDEVRELDRLLVLEQNRPNPANKSTEISFYLPSTSTVTLIVTATDGREVARPVDRTLAGGVHSVVLSTEGFAPGLYLYRLDTKFGSQARRLIVQH